MRLEAIETEEYRHHTIEIHIDDTPESPREWTTFGSMTAFHSRYKLGDEHEFTPDELLDWIQRSDVVALPLYLYDHSGLWMSTTREYPFNCPWDSSHIGYIWVTKQKIREEYGVKRITRNTMKKALAVMRGEVDIYSKYISGQVYGYCTMDAAGECVDSCWGFYDIDYMIKEAKLWIDHETREQEGLIYGSSN